MPTIKAMVYRNLHKKCWSLKDRTTGRVDGHGESFYLHNCEFRVSEAGRQRVLRDKRKNVHAGVYGDCPVLQPIVSNLKDWTQVTYDPYKYKSFVKMDGSPVRFATEVLLHFDGKVFAKGIT